MRKFFNCIKGLFVHESILKKVLQTLIVNGFDLSSIRKLARDKTILNVNKFDTLGAEIKYSLLLSSGKPNIQLLDSLQITSSDLNSTPIVISDNLSTKDFKVYTISQFEGFFGGFVNTIIILIDDLANVLQDLGFNKQYDGIVGKPDELFESYTKECLQFLLNSRARLYGNKRRGESLPDGVVIAKDGTIILFDSKACKDGYKFKSDDINRFATYVNKFNKMYSKDLGNVFCFLVISSDFRDSENLIRKRSNTLYTQTGTKLACMRSTELAKATNEIRKHQEYRNSINWKEIFVNEIVSTQKLKREISKIKKDKLI